MTVLVLSPHADDGEIGMGATLSLMAKTRYNVSHAVVCASDYFGRTGHVRRNMRREEFVAACDVTGAKPLWDPFNEENTLNLLPRAELAGWIESLIKLLGVTELYVPLPSANQDHTAIWEAVQVVARNLEPRTIWAYEQPGQRYPLFPEPTYGWEYRAVSEQCMAAKIEAIECHTSQDIAGNTGPCSIRGVRALAEYRGAEAGYAYAERFLLIRKS